MEAILEERVGRAGKPVALSVTRQQQKRVTSSTTRLRKKAMAELSLKSSSEQPDPHVDAHGSGDQHALDEEGAQDDGGHDMQQDNLGAASASVNSAVVEMGFELSLEQRVLSQAGS